MKTLLRHTSLNLVVLCSNTAIHHCKWSLLLMILINLHVDCSHIQTAAMDFHVYLHDKIHLIPCHHLPLKFRGETNPILLQNECHPDKLIAQGHSMAAKWWWLLLENSFLTWSTLLYLCTGTVMLWYPFDVIWVQTSMEGNIHKGFGD
jgi:hypothetical protein